MFVVTGVGGNTGTATAHALLEAGSPVTVVVRHATKGHDWSARGARVVVADAHDVGTMTAAFAGADGAFLLNPPRYDLDDPFAEASALGAALAKAVAAANLAHVVLLSSFGADRDDSGMIRTTGRFEAAFATAKTPVTILRAAAFLENERNVVPAVASQRVYPSFVQPLDRRDEHVAAVDIGACVADLLRGGARDERRVIELSGPEPVSANDIAAAFGRALKTDVTPVAVPREQWEAIFVGNGIGAVAARELATMNDWVNAGSPREQADEYRRGTTPLDTTIGSFISAN